MQFVNARTWYLKLHVVANGSALINNDRLYLQVLQAWKEKRGIADGKQLQGNMTKVGISVFVLALVQLVTDIIGSYCAGQTAAIISVQDFFGAGGIVLVLQVLSVYFGLNAGAYLLTCLLSKHLFFAMPIFGLIILAC
jgi:hypothetical protein